MPWSILTAELQTNYSLKNNPKLIFSESFSTSISLYKPKNGNLSDSRITSTNETSTSNRDLADLYERHNDNPVWRDNLQKILDSTQIEKIVIVTGYLLVINLVLVTLKINFLVMILLLVI